MALHYLTVQDILWINLQVTKKAHSMDYVKLEEATFYQYAYGASQDLPAQAARFLPGFVRQKPFAEGNAATAFIAFTVFLEMNGRHVQLTDTNAKTWFAEQSTGKLNASAVLAQIAEPEHAHHEGVPDVRAAILSVVERFPATIAALA